MERYRDLLVDLARPPLTGLFEPPCLSAPELAMVDALMELLVRPCVGYKIATDAASASLWRLAGGGVRQHELPRRNLVAMSCCLTGSTATSPLFSFRTAGSSNVLPVPPEPRL